MQSLYKQVYFDHAQCFKDVNPEYVQLPACCMKYRYHISVHTMYDLKLQSESLMFSCNGSYMRTTHLTTCQSQHNQNCQHGSHVQLHRTGETGCFPQEQFSGQCALVSSALVNYFLYKVSFPKLIRSKIQCFRPRFSVSSSVVADSFVPRLMFSFHAKEPGYMARHRAATNQC